MSEDRSSSASSCNILQPGMLIRPQMDEGLAIEFVESLYGLKVKSIKELNSYDDKNYKVEVAADYNNANIRELWPHGYILKVLNSMDSKKTHLDAEHQAMAIWSSAGVACPLPVLDIDGRDKSLQKIYHKPDKEWQDNNPDLERPYGEHVVRLLTFIPGRMLVEVPYTPKLLYKAGKHIGWLEKILKEKGFTHPAFANHQTMWNLISVPRLTEFLHAVVEETRRELVLDIVAAFKLKVLSQLDQFQKGIIHGDYNEQNILVAPSGDSVTQHEDNVEHEIVGVLDFGDMMDSYFVFEIAITIMYMMVESKVVDPLLAGGHVLAGYLSQMSLLPVEFSVLKTCVAARFCQSLVLGAYSYMQDPGNDYLVVTAANGWPLLEKLWDTPEEQLYAGWRQVMDSYKE